MNGPREATPREVRAVEELRAKGITPTVQAVEEWLSRRSRARKLRSSVPRVESTAPEAPPVSLEMPPPEPTPVFGYDAAPRPGPGRRRKVAPWFPAVAETMANGTTLREALIRHGILGLTERETQNLYRNVTFKRLYMEARRRCGMS